MTKVQSAFIKQQCCSAVGVYYTLAESAYCFFVRPLPFLLSPFLTVGKPKCFNMSVFKLTGTLTILQLYAFCPEDLLFETVLCPQ